MVEVGLFFVNQENDGLRQYEKRFSETLSQYRPVFKRALIRLQISQAVVGASRPHRFPHIKSREADLIIGDFEELIRQHRDKLLPWSARLLREFVSATGSPSFPSLLRHFDAIIVNEIPESYPGKPHPDDPVVELQNVTQYCVAEIDVAAEKALRSKDRGPSYTCDMLVLHTVRADHKPYFPGTAMHASEIAAAAIRHLPSLKQRFNEVWFLNAYFSEQKQRLHRLM